MPELLRIFPSSAGLNKQNEPLDGKPVPLNFLDVKNDAPAGRMKDYSKVLELLRKYQLNENIYAHEPWKAYLAFTNIAEHLLQNNERISMFIDDVISEMLLLASPDDIYSHIPKGMDIILNGPPTKEQFEKWMKLQEKENISVEMLPEYNSEFHTLIFGGSSYMFWRCRERFTGEITPTKPEYTSRLNFNDEKTLKHLVEYWSSGIKPRAVALSAEESPVYSK